MGEVSIMVDVDLTPKQRNDKIADLSTNALEEAYKTLIEALDEYWKQNPESTEIETLKKYLDQIYAERKASILVGRNLQIFTDYLMHALTLAMAKSLSEEKPQDTFTKLYYSNSLLLKNG
jgi:hypothetical protein